MIFLRVLRIVFIIGGIAAAAVGIIMMTLDLKATGGGIGGNWMCEPDPSGQDRTVCRTTGMSWGGPGGLTKGVGWLSVMIGGVVLVGAAIAIGQFDRPRQQGPVGGGPDQQQGRHPLPGSPVQGGRAIGQQGPGPPGQAGW